MMDVSILGLNELEARFNAFPDVLNAALLSKSQDLVNALQQKVQDNLSGAVLAEKTGLLKSSIDTDVEDTGNGASASVFVGGDVPYAAIQEYGGQTKAHIIEATQGKALAFNWAGKQAFFTRINHPGSYIPERSYLRSAFGEMQGEIVDGFGNALADSITR